MLAGRGGVGLPSPCTRRLRPPPCPPTRISVRRSTEGRFEARASFSSRSRSAAGRERAARECVGLQAWACGPPRDRIDPAVAEFSWETFDAISEGKAAAHQRPLSGRRSGRRSGTIGAGRLRRFKRGGFGSGGGGTCALDGSGRVAGDRNELPARKLRPCKFLPDAPDCEDEIEHEGDDACPSARPDSTMLCSATTMALTTKSLRAIVMANSTAESSPVFVPAARRSAKPRPGRARRAAQKPGGRSWTVRAAKMALSASASAPGQPALARYPRSAPRPRPEASIYSWQADFARVILPDARSTPPWCRPIRLFFGHWCPHASGGKIS